MNVLLVDLDSKMSNLALMKLSSYHKKIGDNISIKKLKIPFYNHRKGNKKIIDGKDFDKIYVSCIFKNNKDMIEIQNIDKKNIEWGVRNRPS